MNDNLAIKKAESLSWLKTAFAHKPSSFQGGDFLEEVRQQAFASFLQRGLPTRREEGWKYTDISFLEKMSFQQSQPVSLNLLEQPEWRALIEERARDNLLVVLVNGHYVSQLSVLSALPEGVIVTSMREALASHTSLVSRYLLKEIDAQRYPFASLNAAFFSDGVFLYVPPSIQVDKPLHILSLTCGQDGLMMHPRHVLILESDTQLSVTEEYRSAGSQHYWVNASLDCFVGRNAQVNYYKVQNEASVAYHFATLFFYQQQNSSLNSCSFTTGGRVSRNELTILLQEAQAACRTKGFYGLNADGQLIDHHIHIDHAAAHTQSVMDYRGVLAKQSRAVFNGKVLVRPEAKKTQAQQFNHNLLLSPLSEVDTKPELEIYADEVQCRHGATTGQLDEDSLFYLGTRGIDQPTAVIMLLQAFVEAVLKDVTLPRVVQMMHDEWGRQLAKP